MDDGEGGQAALEKKFWADRWHEGRIRFHLDFTHPRLDDSWPLLGPFEAGQSVLVPLCGKSLDLLWFHRRGYKVIGVELVEEGARQFFADNGLEAEVVADGFMLCWRGLGEAAGLAVFQGDFFDLRPEDIDFVASGPIARVYDRAALIALPKELRTRYAAQLRKLAPEADQMIITLRYPQEEMDGPPFSVDRAELERLYGTHWQLDTLDDRIREVLSQNEHFREKGLTELWEEVTLATRRAPVR